MTGTRTSPDLLFQDEIRAAVREVYGSVPHGAGEAVARRHYAPDELAGVADETVAWTLGVGNPVRHAALRPGEVVVDLGCGGGIDTVLAARRVGPAGLVIGLDMLPEMADRARDAAVAAGVGDVTELEVGEMEALPLPDASVDVVISNGVLNLSPRKSRAIAEVVRILRPGGRICLTDLVVDRDLPPEVLASGAAWAGCIAGAVSERVLAGKLARAGLGDVTLDHRIPFSLDDVVRYPLFTPEVVDLMRRVLPPEAQREVATSVVVQASKPMVAPRRPAPVDGTPTGVTPLDRIDPDHVEAPGVVVRNLKHVEDVHLKVLDVEPGGATPYHHHPHAHEGVVVAGTGALRLGRGDQPLGPGDVFTVNPNEAHAIACDEGGQHLRFVCMDCFVE